MIIDMHAHIWEDSAQICKKQIKDAAQLFNISRVIVSSLNSLYPDEDEIKRLNSLTYSFMIEEPNLIKGYCYLNPRHRNCIEQLKLCVEERGMCGIKLWVATFCDDPLVDPIVEQAIKYNIPILIHAFHKSEEQLEFESLGENVANLSNRYPEAKLIMAHLGANSQRELWPIISCNNVWVDFSGSISPCDDVEYAVKLLGAKRVLFGSDMPDGLSFLVSYGQILEAQITKEEKSDIMYNNAKKLFERN